MFAGHPVAVHGGTPHRPATPPPPHVCPSGQVPQLRRLPQPSPVVPHSMPCAVQVVPVHVGFWHLFAAPPHPQHAPAVLQAHVSNPPQPSLTLPQVSAGKAAHDFAVQFGAPQTPGTPAPPQV